MLILQELGLSVDLMADPQSAIRWAKQARYEIIVAGGTPVPLATLARTLRDAAPEPRIVLLAEEWGRDDDLDALGVQVLRPPLDVNALMRGLAPSNSSPQATLRELFTPRLDDKVHPRDQFGEAQRWPTRSLRPASAARPV